MRFSGGADAFLPPESGAFDRLAQIPLVSANILWLTAVIHCGIIKFFY